MLSTEYCVWLGLLANEALLGSRGLQRPAPRWSPGTPWHLSFTFFWSWCWLFGNRIKMLSHLPHSHNPFSLWFKTSCYSYILCLSLFTSLRQSKYHRPLFIKSLRKQCCLDHSDLTKNAKVMTLNLFQRTNTWRQKWIKESFISK